MRRPPPRPQNPRRGQSPRTRRSGKKIPTGISTIPPIRKPPERPNKSESLKALEAELEKFYDDANKPQKQDKPENADDARESTAVGL